MIIKTLNLRKCFKNQKPLQAFSKEHVFLRAASATAKDEIQLDLIV